ncbi:MAG: hypothetical protein KAQ91_02925 [Methylococcales bacterium]|nr:hypothetical protein [Methylococcales bacterium]
MKFKTFFLFVLLVVFSNQSFALSTDNWEYKTITGHLKPTPGCKTKDKAIKQASSGHRFKKYTKLLCNEQAYGWNKKNVQMPYGWSLEKVEDKGQLVCEACEGEYEGEEKYRCFMENVVVKCKTVEKGW